MAQIELDQKMSFSLSAENRAECKEQSVPRSAQFSAPWRRSGCSPAEPYPPHGYGEFSTYFSHPLQRGHLYLAE
jgi:hypothetical protein